MLGYIHSSVIVYIQVRDVRGPNNRVEAMAFLEPDVQQSIHVCIPQFSYVLSRERWWCNGQHCCLPSSRSGFDSRPTHIFFSTRQYVCTCVLLFAFFFFQSTSQQAQPLHPTGKQ